MRAVVYRQSILTILLFTAVTLIAIMTFNYFVDPGNRFFHATAFEKEIAEALLNGKKVMFHTNYNDRGVEKIFLEKLTERPDVLIIGSSRAMPINQASFHTTSFYNASVTSASMEDIVSIYYLYQKKGNPKVLLLSLDPWILDKNHGMKKWELAFLSDYISAKNLLLQHHDSVNFFEKSHIFFEKYTQLLSLEYTHVALRKALLPTEKEVIIDPAHDACPACYTRFPDGTRIFSVNQESTTAQQADLASINGIQQYARDYGDYTKLDPDYKNIFEHLIEHVTQQHVKIIFYLPAYEPVAYKAISQDKKYQMIEESEKYFMTIAEKYHIPVVGRYDPHAFHLQAQDFVDDLHLKKQPIENIFKQHMLV